MINQEKVKDMTKMAVYESHGGDKELAVCAYRRKDYVALQMLKSFILGTISYLIILAFYLLVHLDIIETLNTFVKIGRFVCGVGVTYLIFLVAFLVITFLWARKKYKLCEAHVQSYSQELNRVARSYQDPESET